MDKKRKRVVIILSFVIIFTLAFIWIHSCMDMEESSEESGFFFEILCPFLELFVGKGNATELLLRKLAHFTEFFVLGLELILYMRMIIKASKPILMINAWVFGTLCALIDETVQIFSGRGSMIADVWLDSAGCFCGVGIMMCVIVIVERKKKK